MSTLAALDGLEPTLEQLAGALQGRGWTVAVAESCTGGLISTLLTSVPGSSSFFLGAIVPYHDSAKHRLLGVPPDLVKRFGAVSGEVAEAMASGAQRQFGSSIAVGVTGIAGPGGARPGKPVGLTFVATCDPKGHTRSSEHRWEGDRDSNRLQAARAALGALLGLTLSSEE